MFYVIFYSKRMTQVDSANFFSVILSLIKICAICYGILFIYLFYPFVSSLKVGYHFLSKTKQTKEILIRYLAKS